MRSQRETRQSDSYAVGSVSLFLVIIGAVCLRSRRARHRSVNPGASWWAKESCLAFAGRPAAPEAFDDGNQDSFVSEVSPSGYSQRQQSAVMTTSVKRDGGPLGQNPVPPGRWSWRTWWSGEPVSPRGPEDRIDYDVKSPSELSPAVVTGKEARVSVASVGGYTGSGDDSTSSHASTTGYSWTGLAPAPAQGREPEEQPMPRRPDQKSDMSSLRSLRIVNYSMPMTPVGPRSQTPVEQR